VIVCGRSGRYDVIVCGRSGRYDVIVCGRSGRPYSTVHQRVFVVIYSACSHRQPLYMVNLLSMLSQTASVHGKLAQYALTDSLCTW